MGHSVNVDVRLKVSRISECGDVVHCGAVLRRYRYIIYIILLYTLGKAVDAEWLRHCLFTEQRRADCPWRAQGENDEGGAQQSFLGQLGVT